ncbi:MAG: zinc ribbon domain-containing protein [Lachnospiraceae bacterium]|nr:zinc ribbon domain-containing protein [Lachnospiraceae bacterium]
MAFCAKCGTQVPDGVAFCTSCGAPMGAAAPGPEASSQAGGYQANYQQPYQVQAADPWDHTAEFDPQDVSENKVFALLGYVFSLFGVLFVYLGAKDSKYAMFHAKNAVTISVVMGLVFLATALLSWTCIVPIAGAIFELVILIVNIICIFDVFKGKAKEPAIIRGMNFLK